MEKKLQGRIKHGKLELTKTVVRDLGVRSGIRTGGDTFSATCGGCPQPTAFCKTSDGNVCHTKKDQM
jgi:hypothetical protein